MRFLVLMLVVMAMTTGSLAASCPSPRSFMEMKAPDIVQKAWIASQIYSHVKYDFAHFGALPPSYDLDRAFHALLVGLSAARSRFVFDKAVSGFFADLHNSHTWFYDNLAACRPGLPLKADFMENKWVITHSADPDIVVGSEIMAIDGRDFAGWVASVLPYIADTSIRGQRHLPTSRGYGAWLWPERFSLTLRLPSGKAHTLKVDRNATRAGSRSILSSGRYEPPDGVRVEEINSALLRVSISDFGNPAHEQAAIDAIRHNRDRDAILLDLRETEGGMIPVRLAMALARRPFPDMISFSPRHDAVDALQQGRDPAGRNAYGQSLVKSGGGLLAAQPLYQGRVFFLTDNGCASACEGFLMLMRQARRGVILGSPTWGMNGGSLQIPLQDTDMAFHVGVERVFWADGTPFEGIGVLPDKALPLTQAELVEGKDEVLQKAVSFVNGQKDMKH